MRFFCFVLAPTLAILGTSVGAAPDKSGTGGVNPHHLIFRDAPRDHQAFPTTSRPLVIPPMTSSPSPFHTSKAQERLPTATHRPKTTRHAGAIRHLNLGLRTAHPLCTRVYFYRAHTCGAPRPKSGQTTCPPTRSSQSHRDNGEGEDNPKAPSQHGPGPNAKPKPNTSEHRMTPE